MQEIDNNRDDWTNNKPVDNIIYPYLSILPKGFRTISELTEVPLLSEDLYSITEPIQIINKIGEI